MGTVRPGPPALRRVPVAARLVAALALLLATACGDGGGHGDGGDDDNGGRATPTAAPTAVPAPTATPPLPAATPAPGPLAWAAGGMLVSRSADAGGSWRAVFNVGTGSALGVDFVDRRTGWVVGGGNLYRTTTGGGESGAAWESQAGNVDGPPVDLYDVAFADAARGVAVGAAIAAPSRGPLVLVTADGGARWRRVALDALALPATGWLTRVCMTPEGRGLAVGSGGIAGAPALALATADAGLTWTSVLDAVRSALPRVAGLTLGGCACGAAGDAWVVGAPSFLAATTDGGRTWSRRTVGDRPELYLSAVFFADRARGWVAGYDGARGEVLVLRTTDGGARWDAEVLATDVSIAEAPPYGALAAADPATIVFVGDDPQSFGLEAARALGFVSRDGGATWTASAIPGGVQAFADVDVVP